MKRHFMVGAIVAMLGLCAATAFAADGEKKDDLQRPPKPVFSGSATAHVVTGSEPDAYIIGAVLSVTGPAASLGIPEKQTVEMLATQLNAEGGINGVPVKMIIYDDESSEEKAKELVKKLIDQDKVLVILGPSRSGNTMAVKDIAAQGKTTLISCAAAEAIVNPVNPWIFKTPQNDNFAARLILRDLKDEGLKNVAMIYENTSFGQEGFKQIKQLSPDYAIPVRFGEAFIPEITEQNLKILAVKINDDKEIQAIINWAIVPAQIMLPEVMKNLGMSLPLYYSHGFGNPEFIKEAGVAAEGIIFPSGRLLVADDLPFDHPQKDDLSPYKMCYEKDYKEAASAFGGYAYDAFWIAAFAIEQAGAEREKIREAIENMKITGVTGAYQFSPTDHNGLTLDSMELLTVKQGRFCRMPIDK